eukprot:1212436-Rhodomonas_salina.1
MLQAPDRRPTAREQQARVRDEAVRERNGVEHRLVAESSAMPQIVQEPFVGRRGLSDQVDHRGH